MAKGKDVAWWLVTLNQHGVPTLNDGPHSERAGADRALYLLGALNLKTDARYAVAEVRLSEPRPTSEGVNHGAVATCVEMMRIPPKPKRRGRK